MKFINILAFTGIILMMISCNHGTNNIQLDPGGNEVWIKNNQFEPDVLKISEGTVVTWTNLDNTVHSLTSLDRLFDTEVANGERFSFTFRDAGTYEYTCKIHALHGGIVIVE